LASRLAAYITRQPLRGVGKHEFIAFFDGIAAGG